MSESSSSSSSVATPARAVGTCFGFAVRSPLPFHYLRAGDGQALEVSAPSEPPDGDAGAVIVEWRPTPTFPFEGRLHRAGSAFHLWVGGSGWFLVDPEAPSVTVPETANVVRREERLWSIPAILCFRARGDMALHAAAVELDGGAVVLGAPRTFGKTTLAAAFHARGHRLLTEDVTCVRDPERPHVVPGPAMLRLRRDVAAQLELPDARPVGDEDDRVHLATDPSVRGDCRPVPLRGIVLLRHGDDRVALERVPPAQAVRDLWWLSFRLPIDGDRERCFAGAVDLARSVPVWNLYRPLRIADLQTTVDRLADALSR